jgi:lysophospholipase L1-like esterase
MGAPDGKKFTAEGKNPLTASICPSRNWKTSPPTGGTSAEHSRRMRIKRLLTAAVIAALVGTACSGSPIVPTAQPGPIDPALPPSTAPTPPTLSMTRFLAFGDSMTEGTVSQVFQMVLSAGLPTSYPYKLQERLTAIYTAQTIVALNGGKAGEWAVEGVKRLPDVMREAGPNVVFLMEGVNDLNGLAALGNGAVSPTIGALESMVKYAKARGVRVFLATLPPQRRGGLRAASIDILPRFNEEIRKTAAEEGATLVDVNSAFDPALIGQDGLHPTEAGYSRLAEIFLDAINAAFRLPGQPSEQTGVLTSLAGGTRVRRTSDHR